MSLALIVTIVSISIIFIMILISYKLVNKKKNNPEFNEDKVKNIDTNPQGACKYMDNSK